MENKDLKNQCGTFKSSYILYTKRCITDIKSVMDTIEVQNGWRSYCFALERLGSDSLDRNPCRHRPPIRLVGILQDRVNRE